MAPKWYEYAEKRLKKGEEIDKNYEGRLDGNFGYLFITNQRLLFVKQEGFLRKSYDIILDVPKENVKNFEKTGSYQMDIVESSGKRYNFESDIGVSIIQESLQRAIA